MTVIRLRNNQYQGLSSDTKPTTAATNALFLETDTGINWIYNGTSWVDLIKSGTEILTNKTIDADLNTIVHQNMVYDYVVYPSGGKYVAKNTKTGVIDYTDSNPFLDPILNSIITANASTGVSIKLSPDNFIVNNVISVPAQASGQPSFTINGTLSGRAGRGTTLQAANNSSNLNNHSFFESLGGTAGTNNGAACDIGGMTLYNPNFATFGMGGIAIESDIFHTSYAGLHLHDLTLFYASAGKGGIYLKGKGMPVVENIFSLDANASYVGTIDFCFIGGATDATGGQFANDHTDGLIHAQIRNLRTSHTGTGVQGAGGSMQHTLWLGLKYGKLSQISFDGWAFTDDPIVIKDCVSCIINDIHHQDLNVIDTNNIGTCAVRLFSSDQSSASSCYGNRLYNIRMAGWPATRVHIKCDGAANIGPHHNYIELEEYGNAQIRINEAHGGFNVFALKPGSHPVSTFTQVTPQLDSLQSTSRILDTRGGNLGSVGPYLPSSGMAIGRRANFPSGIVTTTVGHGLLGAVTTGTNGTGSSGYDTTRGARINYITNATAANRTGWLSALVTHRAVNPRIRFRFALQQVNSANNRLYIGLVDTASQPSSGVAMGDTWMDGKNGIALGYRTTDSGWEIIQNNGTATATYASAGLSAIDTNIHTFEISADDANSRFLWSFDYGAFNILNTAVPATSTLLAPMFLLETATTTSYGMYEIFTEIVQQQP